MSKQRKREEKNNKRDARKRRGNLDIRKRVAAHKPTGSASTGSASIDSVQIWPEVQGVPIPVICENPKCGRPFIAANVFDMAVGAEMNLIDCRCGPCPFCGGPGLVPSGMYRNIGAEILFTPISAEDRKMLESALDLIQRGMTAQISPQDFQAVSTQQVPELAELWKMTPAKLQDAYEFFAISKYVLMALLMAYQVTTNSRPSQIDAPANILDAIQNARTNVMADRISRRDGVCGGEARIKGTRVAVWGLQEARQHGITDDTILEMYPTIVSADLSAAWKYVASNQAEIEQLIASNNG